MKQKALFPISEDLRKFVGLSSSANGVIFYLAVDNDARFHVTAYLRYLNDHYVFDIHVTDQQKGKHYPSIYRAEFSKDTMNELSALYENKFKLLAEEILPIIQKYIVDEKAIQKGKLFCIDCAMANKPLPISLSQAQSYWKAINEVSDDEIQRHKNCKNESHSTFYDDHSKCFIFKSQKGIYVKFPNLDFLGNQIGKIYEKYFSKELKVLNNIFEKTVTLIKNEEQNEIIVEDKEWKTYLADELFDMKLGKMLSAKNYTGKHLHPYLRNVNVQWGYLDLYDINEMDFNEKEFEKYQLKKGDILVTEGGEVGRTAIYNGEIEGCCYQNAIHRLRIKKPVILPQYFVYYMKAASDAGLLIKTSSKVTIAHFTAEQFKKFKVLVPPISVQENIISVLDKADQIKRVRMEANEKTNKIIQSIFYQMFGDPITNEKKWNIVELHEAAEIIRDSITPESISNQEYIGLEDIESGTGTILQTTHVNAGDLKSNKFKFTEEFVLYGKLRPYLNKISLPNFTGICSTDILPIKPIKGKSNRHFIAYLLKNPHYIGMATSQSEGANLPRLSPHRLASFKIYLPSIEIQDKFSSLIMIIEKIQHKQQQSTTELNQLFDAIMQKSFNTLNNST